MERKGSVKYLNKAKNAKKDEFYTLFPRPHKEMLIQFTPQCEFVQIGFKDAIHGNGYLSSLFRHHYSNHIRLLANP